MPDISKDAARDHTDSVPTKNGDRAQTLANQDGTPSATSSGTPMSSSEWRSSLALAGVYAVRMWGLFLLLPVFAVHARGLSDGTPVLIGLALGIYGMTQAILQIPFGRASDRFGRKPVITAGLIILAIGSVVAATATTVVGVIVGRAIQGAGAVAAAIMALTSDSTREENRGKAMAIVGISIGTSIMLAFMVSPVLAAKIGVSGIFWLIAVLAVVAILLLWFVVPKEPVAARAQTGAPRALGSIFKSRQLLGVVSGIFTIHTLLMSLFIALPLVMVDRLGLALGEHWKVYVPVLLASVPVLGVVGRRMRDGGAAHRIMIVAAFAIFVGLLGLASLEALFPDTGQWLLMLALWFYFCGFNVLETALPALVSRIAPPGTKGTALGVFSSFQFLGIFVGGMLSGTVLSFWGPAGVFLIGALLIVPWLIAILRLGPPTLAASVEIATEPMSSDEARSLQERLCGYDGVVDATVLAEQGIAYLSVDENFDRNSLEL